MGFPSAARGCTPPPELETLLPNRPLLLPFGSCHKPPPAAMTAGPGISHTAHLVRSFPAAGGGGPAGGRDSPPTPSAAGSCAIDAGRGSTCCSRTCGSCSGGSGCPLGEGCTGDSGSCADAPNGLESCSCRQPHGAPAAAAAACADIADAGGWVEDEAPASTGCGCCCCCCCWLVSEELSGLRALGEPDAAPGRELACWLCSCRAQTPHTHAQEQVSSGVTRTDQAKKPREEPACSCRHTPNTHAQASSTHVLKSGLLVQAFCSGHPVRFAQVCPQTTTAL